MQLSYRGHHYDAQIPQLEQDGVEEIGVYRGALLTRKHFNLAAQRHNKVELTYRGVKYAHDV